MTAMMAFFLIMWLLNVTDKDTRKALANYFNPVYLAEDPTSEKGLNDPQEVKKMGTSADGEKDSALKGTQGEGTGPGKDLQGAQERALFQDPYAVLAEIVTETDPKTPTSPDAAIGESGATGTGSGDATRDPFDPVYWQMTASRRMRTEQPGLSGNTNTPADGFPDAGSRRDDAGPPAAGGASGVAETGDAGQPASGEASARPEYDRPAKKGSKQNEAQALQTEIAADLREAMPAGKNSQTPQVQVRATKDGLVVSLTDNIDFSMFAVGSAVPDPKLVRAMEKIGETLAKRPGNIVISGYTDARPFRSERYDNWQLSTARAHIAQYMLVRGGLEEDRVTEIVGFADRKLKNAADPHAPENRRIEILLKGQNT
jgi:chemotaxis protein MotB